MSEAFSVTGGGQIGWVHSSLLVRLTASSDQLTISGILGSYDFKPAEVAALEPCGLSIRIVHTSMRYPEKVIFRGYRDAPSLIDKIAEAGFVPRADRNNVPIRGGIPIRWSFVIAFTIGWNALFLLDRGHNVRQPGALAVLALTIVFSLSLFTSRMAALQSIVLKPGRNVGEISPFLRLVQVITGLLLAASILSYLHILP